MTAALWFLGQLLVAALSVRAATCPLGWMLDGIEPSGRYDCLLVAGDNDDAPLAVLPGRAWCRASELAIYIDPRHAACVATHSLERST